MDRSTGRSLVEPDKIALAGELLQIAPEQLLLPIDHVVVKEIKPGAANQVVTTIGPDDIAVDIGPATIAKYAEVIGSAKTIIWNGPMGIFEMPPFDNGTV